MYTRNTKLRQSNHIREFFCIFTSKYINLHADSLLGLGSGESEEDELPFEPLPFEPQTVNEEVVFDLRSDEFEEGMSPCEPKNVNENSSMSDQVSDRGLEQTPSSAKKHKVADSVQSDPVQTDTVEWSGPIEYVDGFSAPANLGVTCFLNVVFVAMYQSFRINPNAWEPTSIVGQEIRKILRTMGMPHVDHQIMHKRSLMWLLEQLNIPHDIQNAFDETWALIMEHFSDCPMVTTNMSRSCVVCQTKSTTDEYPNCLLRLPVPVDVQLGSVNLQDLLKPSSNSGKW